jgi:hypothetical protein
VPLLHLPPREVEAVVRELGGELSAHVLADSLAHGRAEPTCDAQRVHSQKGVPLRLVESDPHAQERQVPYCVGAKLKASEGREATHVLCGGERVSARVGARRGVHRDLACDGSCTGCSACPTRACGCAVTTPRHLARREDDSDHNTQGKVVGVAPYQLEGRRRRAVRHVLVRPRKRR